MAKNPKWWKDTNDEPSTEDQEPKRGFDPAKFDGQQVTDSLTHEELDAVIAHRALDASELAADSTKAEKVEFINGAAVL